MSPSKLPLGKILIGSGAVAATVGLAVASELESLEGDAVGKGCSFGPPVGSAVGSKVKSVELESVEFVSSNVPSSVGASVATDGASVGDVGDIDGNSMGAFDGARVGLGVRIVGAGVGLLLGDGVIGIRI